MIRDLVQDAKTDKQSMYLLLQQFRSLINKYSRVLKYEEAKTDIIIAFIEMIKVIDLDKLQHDGEIVNYIHKTMKNKKVDLFRKNILSKTNNELVINEDIIADDNVNYIESNIMINDILDKLSKKQRIVLKRKLFFHYSDRDIAEDLKISRQAVNRIKNRGIKKIKQYF